MPYGLDFFNMTLVLIYSQENLFDYIVLVTSLENDLIKKENILVILY